MTNEERKAVEEFTENNLTKKGLYHYNDMQDAFLIGLFKGQKMQSFNWHKVEDSLPDNGREVLAKDYLGNYLLARYDGTGWDVSVYDDEDYRCHIGISAWCDIESLIEKEDDTRK